MQGSNSLEEDLGTRHLAGARDQQTGQHMLTLVCCEWRFFGILSDVWNEVGERESRGRLRVMEAGVFLGT